MVFFNSVFLILPDKRLQSCPKKRKKRTDVSRLRQRAQELLEAPFGENNTLFIMKEDQDIYYLYNKQVCEIDAPQGCDLRIQRNDGSTLWVHVKKTAVQNNEGTPYGDE